MLCCCLEKSNTESETRMDPVHFAHFFMTINAWLNTPQLLYLLLRTLPVQYSHPQLQLLVFILCPKQNIPQLHFQTLCFSCWTITRGRQVQGVMLRGLVHHPCKSYAKTKFLLFFHSALPSFCTTVNPLTTSFPSWSHLLLCGFPHTATGAKLQRQPLCRFADA